MLEREKNGVLDFGVGRIISRCCLVNEDNEIYVGGRLRRNYRVVFRIYMGFGL